MFSCKTEDGGAVAGQGGGLDSYSFLDRVE